MSDNYVSLFGGKEEDFFTITKSKEALDDVDYDYQPKYLV